MRINNNVTALSTARNLGRTQDMQAKNVEKLSTGLRINRAGDDASGLVISKQLSAQVSGLTQAVRNAQDGVSVLQTAEGALDQVNTMLQRMRDLSVQAANSGTQSAASRQAGQAEANALSTEINRISSTTKFGALSLLDGTFGITAATLAGAASTTDSYTFSATNMAFSVGGGTTVTAAVAAGTAVNGSAAAASLQSAIRSALAGSTSSSNQYYADKVTVTSTSTTSNGVTSSSLQINVAGATSSGVTFNVGTTVGGLVTTGSSSATAGSGGIFQVGANSKNVAMNEQIAINFQSYTANTLGVATLDLTTDSGAANAIDAIDKAISTVSTARGTIGATQNRFDALINNLNTTVENLTASDSRIRDVDMASEMVDFTKNQVLAQAGQAMLAQANQIPQGVLSLLRG